MKYVDANILIYAFTDTTRKGLKSREVLSRQELATSTLSLDEVSFKLGKKSLDFVLAALDVLEHMPNLQFIPFSSDDFPAFRSMLKRGLGPRDAIHALTALKTQCESIYSEDKDLDGLVIPRKTPW